MGLFKKRNKVVDWSEGYRVSVRRLPAKTASSNDSDNSALGFLGNLAESSASSDSLSWDNDAPSSSETVGEYSEKKQKLAKRLLDMTNKIEELSNQIYHLNQRIEVLEKKLKLNYG